MERVGGKGEGGVRKGKGKRGRFSTGGKRKTGIRERCGRKM